VIGRGSGWNVRKLRPPRGTVLYACVDVHVRSSAIRSRRRHGTGNRSRSLNIPSKGFRFVEMAGPDPLYGYTDVRIHLGWWPHGEVVAMATWKLLESSGSAYHEGQLAKSGISGYRGGLPRLT
jgi:hypothetical protein